MVAIFARALNRVGAVASMGAVATAGVVVLMSSPASAAPAWCGAWLQYPANATKYAVVAGTTGELGNLYDGKRSYLRVLAGLSGGEWYAFAKAYNVTVFDGGLALKWRYSANNGVYQCGDSKGSPTVIRDSNVPGNVYTAGVDYPHASRVQAQIGREFGPTANFTWPG